MSLNTVLQNVEVLSVTPVEQGPGHPGIPIITVLTKPGDSDIVALADSGTHLRVALRNPLDSQTEPRKALSVPELYRTQEAAKRATPKAQRSIDPAGSPLHASRLQTREMDPPVPAGRQDGAAGRGR